MNCDNKFIIIKVPIRFSISNKEFLEYYSFNKNKKHVDMDNFIIRYNYIKRNNYFGYIRIIDYHQFGFEIKIKYI